MLLNCDQGSSEWLAVRLTKITGSDASIIMGNNPWKSLEQLLQCKRGLIVEKTNEMMLEGQRLEPIARKIYEELAGYEMKPSVHTTDIVAWAMASVDGLSEDGKILLEIKCGKKSYEQAKKNYIPDYYLDQIQHCLWVTGAEECDYMAFNEGKEPIYMKVEKNLDYINEMIHKEYEFFTEMINGMD
jgi:putative phage-type endonuclease